MWVSVLWKVNLKFPLASVNEILRPILKLYKSKQNHNLLTSVISTAETKTIIQKKGRDSGMNDAHLAYELSAYHIMYAPSDLRRSLSYVPGYVQCEKLKKDTTLPKIAFVAVNKMLLIWDTAL